MLRCSVVNNEHTQRGSFVESIDLSIRSSMRRWWVDDREAKFEDLTHQARSLLDLQGRRWKTPEKEGQWTETVRRSTKGPREKESHAASWKSTTTAHRACQEKVAFRHHGRDTSGEPRRFSAFRQKE